MKCAILLVSICLLSTNLTACKQARDVKEILTGGTFSGGKASDVKLANQARQEMCCASITIGNQTTNGGKTTSEVFGCGEIATYEFSNSKWTQTSIMPDTVHGTKGEKTAGCK